MKKLTVLKTILCILPLFILGMLLTGCDLDSLSGKKGSLTITSAPESADILVDGVPKGQTPVVLEGLPMGQYVIEAQKEGYETLYKNIGLLEGQDLSAELKLKPVTGLLLIDSNPQGSDVLIDGVSHGYTPLLLTELPLGEYNLEFRSASLMPRTMSAKLKDRTPVRVFAELVSNTARLEVTSIPDESEVHLDGILMGVTPLVIEAVHAGRSDLKVFKRGYTPYQKRMDFAATQTYEVCAELVALPAGLTIMSEPEGAKIMIDKRPVGVTPVTIDDLKDGPHEVYATLEGYAEKTKVVYLEPNINDIVEFEMVKNSGTLVVDTEPAGVDIYLNGKKLGTTMSESDSDSMSAPLSIILKSGQEHVVQFVRDGYVSSKMVVEADVNQIVTHHEVLKRIFIRDTIIFTQAERIKCRVEYTLPNGDIYYERFPGVFDTAKAEDIRGVKKISMDDESNRDARQLILKNKQNAPK